MAPVTPVGEPLSITAGSTATWTVSSATYPVAEGWALSYAFNGASTLSWSSGYVSNDGSTHTVTLPPAATLPLSPGRYEVTRIWTGSGSYAGQRFDEALPPLTIVADPATQRPGSRLAFAEKNLAAVEAAITARLCGDQPEEYEIGGRSVTKIPIAELRKIRSELAAEVFRLRNPGTMRSTYVRFTVPV